MKCEKKCGALTFIKWFVIGIVSVFVLFVFVSFLIGFVQGMRSYDDLEDVEVHTGDCYVEDMNETVPCLFTVIPQE